MVFPCGNSPLSTWYPDKLDDSSARRQTALTAPGGKRKVTDAYD